MFIGLVLATVIVSTTEASANSGGNSTSQGTVVSGSSGASAESTVTMGQGTSGTVVTEVHVSSNGEKKSESKTVQLPPEGGTVTVSASSSTGNISSSSQTSSSKSSNPRNRDNVRVEKVRDPFFATSSNASSTATSSERHRILFSYRVFSTGLSKMIASAFSLFFR